MDSLPVKTQISYASTGLISAQSQLLVQKVFGLQNFRLLGLKTTAMFVAVHF